ncbi:MAG: hypothetical protein GY856_23710, partial [bacterium]|nr:hypothetical protein [bacterium]
RDFKPGNVMVRPDGRAVVLDFGLARDDQEDGGEQILRMDELEETSSIIRSPLDGSLTRTGALMGTPAYMAPEQHAGQPARAAADQFAFCSALYEALYGNLPFSSSPPGKARSWEVAEPPASARVPVRIRRILLRGLSIDPADRYPSMRTLLRQLAHDPREKRRRRLIAAAVLVVAVGGALGYARITDRRSRLCRGAEEKLAGIWDEPR